MSIEMLSIHQKFKRENSIKNCNIIKIDLRVREISVYP